MSNDHQIAKRIAAACDAMRAGLPVVLLDDDDRENEADLIAAAETLSHDVMARLIRDCSGIVCLCLDDRLIRQLDLPPMAAKNETRYGTAFTVSIEARAGVTTGVSAADRLTTVRAAIADGARPEHLARPGHVFPLRAQPGGVLSRRGHTEGAVDLARLAGLKPAAVLCELMDRHGEMLRGKRAKAYARRNGFPVLTIAEIAAHLGRWISRRSCRPSPLPQHAGEVGEGEARFARPQSSRRFPHPSPPPALGEAVRSSAMVVFSARQRRGMAMKDGGVQVGGLGAQPGPTAGPGRRAGAAAALHPHVPRHLQRSAVRRGDPPFRGGRAQARLHHRDPRQAAPALRHHAADRRPAGVAGHR